MSETNPDFPKYLALILSLTEAEGGAASVRQPAGLALKSHLDANFAAVPMQAIYYIEDRLKRAFYDPSLEVRKTVSNVMSMIMVRGGFNAWPDLLTFLTHSLQPGWLGENVPHLDQSEYRSIVENSILAISIIVEDCTSLF